jgi:hypothetical protein
MSKLISVDGPLRGKAFEVTELASIGRAESCAVRLQGRHVSRIHARLERKDGATLLRDNDSRNGVFVNGASVKESALKPDDVVEIGEHVLVFEPTGDPEKLPRARAVETLEDPFAAGEADERMPRLLAAAAALAGMDDERELAKRLLEALMVAIPSERGFVMATDGGPLKPLARKSPAGEEEFQVSNVLGAQALTEKKALVAIDVWRKPPDAGKRVGLLCVPLVAKDHALGLACLEAKMADGEERPRFGLADLRFAAALSAFAAQRLAQLRRLASGARLGHKSLPDLVTAFEKEVVVGVLHAAKGDLDAAAKALGVSRGVLDTRLKSLGLVAASPSSAKAPEGKPASAQAPEGKPPAPAAKAPEAKAPPPAEGWKSVDV